MPHWVVVSMLVAFAWFVGYLIGRGVERDQEWKRRANRIRAANKE
jgi:hypothetical protein